MRKHLPLITLFAVVIVTGGILTASAGASPTAGQPPVFIAPQRPDRGTPNPYPGGAPAITPHLDAATHEGATFTAADVQQFIQAHGYAGGATVSGGPPTIEKILFITSKQASNLLNGEDIGRPDNALVCYVALRGPFYSSITAPYGVTPPPNWTEEAGYEVFDAVTGNLLLYGA
jgi:hypothetical protein